MTRRRWIADSWSESSAALRGEPAAHLARVLRATAGMKFDILAGERVFDGTITSVSSDLVEFMLGGEIEAEPALPVTLLLAVFKFDRMEWAIEKATELGVERIVPVIARRTEKHLAQAASARVERWRRIAREAAQQSRRSNMLEIEDPRPLKDAVIEAPRSLRLLLAERERMITLRDALEDNDPERPCVPDQQLSRPVRVAVGPEGGWTLEEETLFAAERWKPVSLGPRILRTETAAVAAISVLAALLD